MAKLDWGSAKRQVLALMPEVDQYLADCHSRQKIYNMFKTEGKIECGYRTFCHWLDRLSDEHPRKYPPKPLPVSTVKPEPKTIPKTKKNSTSADKNQSRRSSLVVHRPEMAGLGADFSESRVSDENSSEIITPEITPSQKD